MIILNSTLRSLPLPESSRSSDSTLTVSWKFDGSLTVADSTFDFSNKAKSAGKERAISCCVMNQPYYTMYYC